MCQAAVSPSAFKRHLCQYNRGWYAVFSLLAHGRLGIMLDEIIGRKHFVFVYLQCLDGFLSRLFYVKKQVVWVFQTAPKPTGDMQMWPSGASCSSADAYWVSCIDLLVVAHPNFR
ncbi:Uncharacterised protein [Segatella copri]|nr:Uncharacterised protein [Segatella copri]